MKINYIVLIRPAHEQSRNRVGQTQTYQQDLGRMKPISFAWNCVCSFPQASEEIETSNRNSQEAPGDSFRGPPKDENELIGKRPKSDCGYREQQNVARAGFGGPF